VTSNDLNLMGNLPERMKPLKQIEKLQLSYPSTHLTGFDDLAAATALFGEEYTLIFKGLWYNLLSYRIRTSMISVGRLKPDGRISPLFVVNSGRGKGEIKRVQKMYVEYFNGKIREPTSLHAEQLVGKSVYIKRDKRHEERKGYLRSDFLIIDEAFNLLSSSDLHYSEARKYIRTALDPYPDNTVSKQLVELGEDHALEYEPECPITLFVQPLQFENDILVLEGDIRRFILIYVYMGDSNKIDALEKRIFDSSNDEASIYKFCEKIEQLNTFETFNMAHEAKIAFAELSILLVQRGESYSKKISNFMEMIVFTLQNNLLKFSAIQAFQNNRSTIEILDIETAYVDLFEIMEHEYEYVEIKVFGNLDYGDGWRGARLKDQESLRWLHEKGAISENVSKVSIKEFEDKLRGIFGVKERQARKYKNKYEENGWIKSKTAPNISKVWLTFDPIKDWDITEATEATGAPYQKYRSLVKKIESTNNQTHRGTASVAPVAPDENSLDHEESIDIHRPQDYESMSDNDLCAAAYHGNDQDAKNILDARILAKTTAKKEGA
jgi:hypothetical protein